MITFEEGLGIQGPLARLRGDYPLQAVAGLDQGIFEKISKFIEEKAVFIILAGGILTGAGRFIGSPENIVLFSAGGVLLAIGILPFVLRIFR